MDQLMAFILLGGCGSVLVFGLLAILLVIAGGKLKSPVERAIDDDDQREYLAQQRFK